MAQRPFSKAGVRHRKWHIACALLLLAATVLSADGADAPRSHELAQPEGRVEVLRKGAAAWTVVTTNVALFPGDAVRTGKDSRAAIRLSNNSVIRLDQLSVMRLPERISPTRRFVINLIKGAAYFFHRERPVETDFETPLVSGAIRGTEFNLAVEDNGRTVLTLLDGEVELSNAQGQLTLRTGEQAVVEPAAAPAKTAVIDAVNVIQWCLYYPAVLDLDELALGDAEKQALAESLNAYRSGDLLQALATYPANRQPALSNEKTYLGQLQLAVGQVPQAEQLLNTIPADDKTIPIVSALRTLILAIKFQPEKATNSLPAGPGRLPPGRENSASALLAESYYAQSRGDLGEAIRFAHSAVELSPKFGFGWTRLAELEFSFGHSPQALEAIEQALRLAPRNAQALAVNGFLLAARRDFGRAFASFDQAIQIDSGLGNAWLGRGLLRIRQSHSDAGRDDLMMAAALEPNRALLRSYLGKAFSQVGDNVRAVKELALAKRIDPNDPTAWLYSALLNQQRNRINEAIDDLEHSTELNENRHIYRSRMLLDEDRAVRGANLASIYQDAGFEDTSFREAVRAANADYANYSAHVFLANSYNQLRDPKQVNVRYETPWLSEYLLANLLAPPEAGVLSQNVSQQEYSRLFERNRLGLVSLTEYQSSGDWLQAASQYGIYNNLAYAADVVYRSQNGQRPNNDLEQFATTLHFKYEITPTDSAYLQGSYYTVRGGDLRQYYDQNSAIKDLRTREKQEPTLIGGWHHEWSPDNHTLLLAARLQDTYTVNYTNSLRAINQQLAPVQAVDQGLQSLDYRNQVVIYSTELQQIFQQNDYKLIGGGRFQIGDFKTHNQMDGCCMGVVSRVDENFSTDFERAAVYGYAHWQPLEELLLIGGVTYDWVKFPENWQAPPVSGAESKAERVSPKVGAIFTPWQNTTLRAAYTRSLGGVSFDQSFQLEPSQIAGFGQSFRSLIPESVAGPLSAQQFETFGVALDQKFATRTYVGVSYEVLHSRGTQTVGSYDFTFPNAGFVTNVHEGLRFSERTFTVTLNQLILDEWSLGAQYRLRHADLEDRFTDISENQMIAPGFLISQHPRATLHQLQFFTIFNHPSGFFSHAQAIWSAQSNSGYAVPEPGDDFWQFNAFVGYRFPHRHAELTFGVLNITDRDYRLNPLTLYTELPRERTAVMRLKINF